MEVNPSDAIEIAARQNKFAATICLPSLCEQVFLNSDLNLKSFEEAIRAAPAWAKREELAKSELAKGNLTKVQISTNNVSWCQQTLILPLIYSVGLDRISHICSELYHLPCLTYRQCGEEAPHMQSFCYLTTKLACQLLFTMLLSSIICKKFHSVLWLLTEHFSSVML